MPQSSVLHALIGRIQSWFGEAADSAREFRQQVREDPSTLVHSPILKFGVWAIFGLAAILAVQWFITGLTPVGPGFQEQAVQYSVLYVACTDPACLASYASRQRMDFNAWPLKCEKCGKPSVYRAAICPKCRAWFAVSPPIAGAAVAPAGCPHCAKKLAAEVKPPPATGPAVDRDDAEDGW